MQSRGGVLVKNVLRSLLTACVMLTLGGCRTYTSTAMIKSDKELAGPTNGLAQLVFMRPSTWGIYNQSTVYLVDADQKGQQFLGIVSSKTEVAYTLPQGDYLFMVIGENADFMETHVEAGKTYYALVSPRVGNLKTRFSLLPIHATPHAKYSIGSADFQQWQSSCDLVEKLPRADQWYDDHKKTVDELRATYLKEWNGRDAKDKADLVLNREDGVSAPVPRAYSDPPKPDSLEP